jgi:hypothetical protein
MVKSIQIHIKTMARAETMEKVAHRPSSKNENNTNSLN